MSEVRNDSYLLMPVQDPKTSLVHWGLSLLGDYYNVWCYGHGRTYPNFVTLPKGSTITCLHCATRS